MKKYLLVFVVFLSSYSIYAQSFFATHFDNYAGVYNVMSNPANLVDSRYRADINLASGSVFANNDYYSVKISDLLNDSSNFENYAKRTPSKSNNFYTNVDVLGPSFQVDLNYFNTIAIFSRVRGIGHITEIDGIYLEDLQDDVSQDYSVNNQNFSLASNAWYEVGASYATIFFNNQMHFLKGGFSLKYLGGIYSGYAKASNLSVNYDYTGVAATSNTTINGQIETGNLQSLNDFDSPIENEGSGFGGDLGLTYEYRTAQSLADCTGAANKYVFKLGVSVTDIGSIRFKEGEKVVYQANNVTFTDAQYAINDDLDTYFTTVSETKSFNVSLPTALHINADWNIVYNKLYLNLNTDINLVKDIKPNSNYIKNVTSLTPRFESKWLSLYLPLSVVENSGFQTGFGFRFGPLTVGSGSVVSSLLGYTKAVDVHVGLKIPIYYNND
ncbi:MAG: hypothetical protein HC854_12465 [Flavobacterium sp.]|nr:hypothetical protein [Flavobacterium sp.]